MLRISVLARTSTALVVLLVSTASNHGVSTGCSLSPSNEKFSSGIDKEPKFVSKSQRYYNLNVIAVRGDRRLDMKLHKDVPQRLGSEAASERRRLVLSFIVF